MMLVSCSCDVFIRPGQFWVVLANAIVVWFQNHKKKEKEDMGPSVRFGSLYLKLIYCLGPGEYK